MAISSFPRPQLVDIFCKDVWAPPRNRQTLANLSKEDSAAVWCAINLKLTNSLFDAKIFFKDNKVLVWEPKYAPAIQDILRFGVNYKHAIMFMMFRMGAINSMMDGPNHPCLGNLKSFEDDLNELHIHDKLIVEMNMDSIDVKTTRHVDNNLFVEFSWSAAAVAQFEAAPVAPDP
jgi:hypothetical protein